MASRAPYQHGRGDLGGAGELPAARLCRLDDDGKIQGQQVIFYAAGG